MPAARGARRRAGLPELHHADTVSIAVAEVADDDDDGDGVAEDVDNCPGVANDQADLDGDGDGDACDDDADGDEVDAAADCDDLAAGVSADRRFYVDGDGDGRGTPGFDVVACLATAPEGYAAALGDNCPLTANAGQENADGDPLGDVCDACPDEAADTVDGCLDGGAGLNSAPEDEPPRIPDDTVELPVDPTLVDRTEAPDASATGSGGCAAVGGAPADLGWLGMLCVLGLRRRR